MNRSFSHKFRFLIFPLLVFLAACGGEVRYQPLAPGSVVLAFGDSVTSGTGAEAGQDYPSLLAQRTGWQVVNGGISGDTAQNARNRIHDLLSEHQPQLVLIELGGNDFLRQRSRDLVKADLLAIIEQSVASGAITVLIAVPRLSMLRASIGALADSPIYEQLAQENNLVLVERVFSEVLSDRSLVADRIHPNARGYQVFTTGLIEKLTEVGLLSH